MENSCLERDKVQQEGNCCPKITGLGRLLVTYLSGTEPSDTGCGVSGISFFADFAIGEI